MDLFDDLITFCQTHVKINRLFVPCLGVLALLIRDRFRVLPTSEARQQRCGMSALLPTMFINLNYVDQIVQIWSTFGTRDALCRADQGHPSDHGLLPIVRRFTFSTQMCSLSPQEGEPDKMASARANRTRVGRDHLEAVPLH